MKGLQPVTHSILADLESLSQRAPRKRTIDAQILDLFVNTRSNSKLSSPKKEYLRCRMIRGHKKSNRIICQKGISKKSILRYQLENPSAKSI